MCSFILCKVVVAVHGGIDAHVFQRDHYVNEKVGIVKRDRVVVLYFSVYKLHCQGICRDVITVLISLV